MQRLLLAMLWVLLSFRSFGQAKPAPFVQPHISIVLVGTFHFGETGDRHKTTFPDLFSARRQAELQALAAQLARLKPDRFFVESEPSRQAYWDSVYARYRQSPGDTGRVRRNEIVQLGMRTARLAGLPRVTGVDHHQNLPYDKINAWAERVEHDTAALRRMAAYRLLALNYPYPKETWKLAEYSLTDYLLHLNTRADDAANRADYFVYAPNYGDGDDYTGVEFITSWYDRNAKIFTNILRATEPTDKLVVLLIGRSHLLPLRHYFQSHPYFEVMELADALQLAGVAAPGRATRK